MPLKIDSDRGDQNAIQLRKEHGSPTFPILSLRLHEHTRDNGRYPLYPADAKGLLKTAIRSSNPVLFVESAAPYVSKGEVPEEEVLIPFGKAGVKLPGNDLAVVASPEWWGRPYLPPMF